MADVADIGVEKSLDDFFAKRDKKKKKEKGRGKEVTPTPSGVKKGKKEKEKPVKTEGQEVQAEKEDQEWKEIEQKEVDYSGLRVQALQISDGKEEEEYDKEEIGEDGEIVVVSGDRTSGPWNKSAGSSGAPAPAAEVEVEEPKQTGVYRPPGARLTGGRKTAAQGPPEIYSDTQFPSLSNAKHVETRKEREQEKTFEVVKHKNRAREEVDGASPDHLHLDNQYAVLGDK